MATETVLIPLILASAEDFDMPEKLGAGGKPQEYAEFNGRFVRKGTDSEATGAFVLDDSVDEFYSPTQVRDKNGKWSLTPGHMVPTRQPSKAGVSLAEGHETTKWDEISDAGKTKMVERLKHVKAPGFEGADTPDQVIDVMKRNILAVHDQVKPEDAAAWKQWYVGAHKIGQDESAASGGKISQDAANAITARLSPQKDWDMNVAQSRSLMHALSKDIEITPEIAGRVAVLKAEAAVRDEASSKKTSLNLDPNEHMGLVGKKLSDLTDEQAAWAIRGNDPNPANHAVQIHADGTYSYDPNLTGRSKTAWQSYDTIMSAVRIYRDQSKESISKELGKEHKVRSFFNNISDPHSSRGDVTTDTHHYGVALGIPVGTGHPLIKSGTRNITGTGGNVKDGVRGTYALFAEATRRAAAERGLEPREMQSVVWMQWRNAYPPASRSRGASKMAEEASMKYDKAIQEGTNPKVAYAQLEKDRAAAMTFASKYAGVEE